MRSPRRSKHAGRVLPDPKKDDEGVLYGRPGADEDRRSRLGDLRVDERLRYSSRGMERAQDKIAQMQACGSAQWTNCWCWDRSTTSPGRATRSNPELDKVSVELPGRQRAGGPEGRARATGAGRRLPSADDDMPVDAEIVEAATAARRRGPTERRRQRRRRRPEGAADGDRPANIQPDRGLTIRMFVTGLLLVVLYGARHRHPARGGRRARASSWSSRFGLLFCQYWFSDKIALFAMHGRVGQTRAGAAGAARDRSTGCAPLADMPKPRLAVARMDLPNAFATGRNPDHAVLCVTRRAVEPAGRGRTRERCWRTSFHTSRTATSR